MNLIKRLMKNKNKKDIWISIPVWRSGFRLLIGLTPDEVKKKYTDFKEVNFNDINAGKYLVNTDTHDAYIWIKNIPNSLDDINTLSHEIFHLTMWILNLQGCIFDINNQEQHAYLNGFITEKIYEEILNN